ncbi:hypothetical protein RND71_024457 [Anisodus tanguticus]|uniref:Uncharacterized protein n=1 Tax=Anisodus tanguticus TaxID=243964 RepID=A0AAE1RPN9_9SOLA|nr:hypothetical protein RND71_024457 [Anisodus tanguticus]
MPELRTPQKKHMYKLPRSPTTLVTWLFPLNVSGKNLNSEQVSIFDTQKDYLKSLAHELFSTNFETSPTSIQFIDAALSCTSPIIAPSYTDPNQISIIRRILISLLQNYPPSIDAFAHNDGTGVNLLNANRELQVALVKSELSQIGLTVFAQYYDFLCLWLRGLLDGKT